MGATNFSDSAIGKFKHAREAYNELVEEAKYDSGHDAYNGTVSTTSGVKDLTSRAPKYGTKAFDKWEEKCLEDGTAEKWGSAIAVEIKGATFKKMKERRGYKGRKGIKAFYMFGWASC